MPTVQFMSVESALALKEPARVLRVAFRHSNYPRFITEHRAVKEVFVDADARIPDDVCKEIVEFIEEAHAADDNIVVHCTEGRFRSRAIANFIWRHFDAYEHEGKEWNGTEMRDNNYKSLHLWHKGHRKGSV